MLEFLADVQADLHWIRAGMLVVAILIFVLWLLHLPRRNASVMDVGWAAGLAIIALLYALQGQGDWKRVTMLTLMGSVWGFRLALYLLFTRVLGEPEESRYVELRRQWGSNASLNFLLFFEAQAVLCGIVSLPFAIVARDAARDAAPELWWFECTGAALWVVPCWARWSRMRNWRRSSGTRRIGRGCAKPACGDTRGTPITSSSGSSGCLSPSSRCPRPWVYWA